MWRRPSRSQGSSTSGPLTCVIIGGFVAPEVGMTRRETLGLLCTLPLLSLSFPFARTRPTSVVLKWDWEPGGDLIDYFEVVVTKGDAAATGANSAVTRVAGHLRTCEVSLPDHGAHVYAASVCATNANGSSVFSAPVILSL
jgi:hypothetical protein